MQKPRESKLYKVWIEMKNRCNNPNNKNYKNYGARNIKVCKQWEQDYLSFYKWAIENGYKNNSKRGVYTLDRIDFNKNYEPNNCRFITIQEQQNNRTNNHFITYNNETHTVSEWSRKLELNVQTIFTRLRMGLPIKYVFSKNKLTTKMIKKIKSELVRPLNQN